MNTTKKILINSIKIAIAFLSFFYIFLKLKQYEAVDFYFEFSETFDFFFLGIAILLMPLNWSIEAKKWKFLTKTIEMISFSTSIKAVLSGITFAIFTPNRIGELAGRIFVLKKQNRAKGVFATATGSLSQMIITIVSGIISGIIFLVLFKTNLQKINSGTLIFVKYFSIFILILGFFILFNLKLLVKFLKSFKISKKHIDSIEILSSYKKNDLLKVLGYSFFRYAVFTFQYFLLLLFFNVEISYFNALLSVALTYFASSVIPTFTFTEIGIRGTAAIFFIGFFSTNISGIISATALLWIINLALPAIIGSYIFYRTKI